MQPLHFSKLPLPSRRFGILWIAFVLVLLSPKASEAQSEFDERFEWGTVTHAGDSFEAIIDRRTGMIHRLRGTKGIELDVRNQENSPAGKSAVEGLIRSFLRSNPTLLRIPAEQIGDAHTLYSSKGWSVAFKQSYGGVEVLGTQIGVSLDHVGRILSFGIRAYPNVRVDTDPNIPSDRVREIVATHFSYAVTATLQDPMLAILPEEHGDAIDFTLIWVISARVDGEFYRILVDAQSGTVLKAAPSGAHFAPHASKCAEPDRISQASELRLPKRNRNAEILPPTATAVPSLVETSGTLSGTVTLEYWHEPTGWQVAPFPNALVRVREGTGGAKRGISAGTSYAQQGVVIDEAYADANGNYSFTLPTGFYDLEFVATTPYARADNNPGDEIRTIEGVYVGTSTDQDYHWQSDRANGVVLMTEMRNYFENEITTNFPLSDTQVNLLNNETQTCFGRSTGPALWISPDYALSSDVVYHEYTHTMIWTLYGGTSIECCGDTSTEAAAMDEGFADYFTAASNQDPSIGESQNCSSGSCNVYRREVENSYTMTDWNSSCFSTYPQHLRGQIISGTQWALKSSQWLWWSLGEPSDFNEQVDEKAYWALWLSPHPTDFVEYYWNLIDAWDAHGHPWYDPINETFCDRGIDTGDCPASKNSRGDLPRRTAESHAPELHVYPVPSVSHAAVEFILPKSGRVRLSIYDLLGRRVRLLLDESRSEGLNRFVLDQEALPSGMYTVRLETESGSISEPLIYVGR